MWAMESRGGEFKATDHELRRGSGFRQLFISKTTGTVLLVFAGSGEEETHWADQSTLPGVSRLFRRR